MKLFLDQAPEYRQGVGAVGGLDLADARFDGKGGGKLGRTQALIARLPASCSPSHVCMRPVSASLVSAATRSEVSV
ncbi:MAG: hypothetical protein JO163_20525 [Methylobacteriaceae bacterium]|nr:hypothetical protein [Methylobacteriaceae bacterium]